MDQWRPAKPDEVANILTETDTNRNSILQNITKKFEPNNKENEARSASADLLKNSLEATLAQAKERTQMELENKKRLEKSQNYEIDGMMEEINFLKEQLGGHQVILNYLLAIEHFWTKE